MFKIRGWKNSWRQLLPIDASHESFSFIFHELSPDLITCLAFLLHVIFLSRDVHLFLEVGFDP